MAAEEIPKNVEHRHEQHDENRVERLEVGCWHLPSENVAVGLLVGKERERRARLLVCRPEEYHEEGDGINHADALALDCRERAVGDYHHRNGDRH